MNGDTLATKNNKSMGDLAREAAWFALHCVLAVLVVVVLAIAMGVTHPNPDAMEPKLILTLLCLAVGVVVGAIVLRSTRNFGGRYIWIAALVLLLGASVWVIDLPTGPGLCEECGSGHLMMRLWRTFFDFAHGSGLMDGAGPLVGCWIPVAMVGYAIGASLAKPRLASEA